MAEEMTREVVYTSRMMQQSGGTLPRRESISSSADEDEPSRARHATEKKRPLLLELFHIIMSFLASLDCWAAFRKFCFPCWYSNTDEVSALARQRYMRRERLQLNQIVSLWSAGPSVADDEVSLFFYHFLFLRSLILFNP